MLPSNPFLQLVPGRVVEALKRLEKRVWHSPVPVEVWAAEPSEAHRTWEQAQGLPLRRVDSPYDWGMAFDQGWFRLAIPEVVVDEPRYLHWHDQGESTLYVDGVPYYGFDPFHTHCALPAGVREVWIESMVYGPGMSNAGCRCEGAWLVARDDAAWRAWHDLQLLWDLGREEHRDQFPPGSIYGTMFGYIPPVEQVSVLYRRLLRRLDEAVSVFDHGDLPALQAALDGIFSELRADPLALDAILTGHAHIDLVWLWPEQAGEFKCVHTFSSMARLMDLYPEMRFNFTQPAGYQGVGRRSPKLLARVKELIAAGQWEATGCSYVESDTQLACGEALARGMVLGQDVYRDLRGGEASTVLWLPDVFGYTACLPQILRQVGVDYFFTTKLTWCSVNRFPYSSFRWQGHDGSEVIAHVTQDFGYNGTTSVGELRAGALAYRQSDVHTQFLAPTGFGDGGGGVTEAMCERARRLSDLAGVPRTRWGKIEDFFAGLEPVRAQLPAWRGELYLEYHRGVMTTHSHAKDAFRGLERALQTHEAVRCAQGGEPLDRHPWERLVFAQFHDYIPGSSIHEVYDEGVAEMRALAGEALAQAAAELGHDGPEALFNPLPVARTVVTERGPVRLAPLAGAPLAELAPVAAEPVRTAPDLLDNGLVRARFDGVGRIVELTVHGQSVAVAAPLGELVVYPDHPHAYPAWDIDRSTLANGVPVTSPTTMVVAAPGVLRCDQALGASSRVSIRYLLEPASPVLRIEYDLDWHDEDTLLKVRFPTAYDGVNARFGHPFGSVLRGQQPGRERDEAQWEVCASRWAAVADDTERDGLMLITEAKYGFTCRQGDLQLSLVRSAYITNEDWHKPIRRTHAEHRVSDIGRHRIRIAVGRYRVDAPREELPATLADTLFTPPLTYRGAALASPLLGLEGGASLVPCWAQPARDGAWVLRLHETLGRRGVAQVRLAPGWQAQAVELSGRPTGQTLDNGLSFGPYSLLSLRLAPES